MDEPEEISVVLKLPVNVLREEARALWQTMFQARAYGASAGPAREILTEAVRREASIMASSPEVMAQVRTAIAEHFPRIVQEEVESVLRSEVRKVLAEAKKRGEIRPTLFEASGSEVLRLP